MDEQDRLNIPLEVVGTTRVTKADKEKEKLINRLKRIEGQVRGIQNMIESDRYCVDVLIQISAVNAALKKVGHTLLEQHTEGCVADAIRSGEGDEAIEELMKVIQQVTK
ncbi:metal-sensing transcriptional repressor [Bacillus sp. FJAT-45037]|uniref:metal-sensing transcriptional repressor n=1 Tax=Bacillus sp. FJAT-45037 TaxID=2011007 RepID=UPI000C23A9DB|nr:metal-sensing transcriptional repressor [Bacillus sp. FJAT-45037]